MEELKFEQLMVKLRKHQEGMAEAPRLGIKLGNKTHYTIQQDMLVQLYPSFKRVSLYWILTKTLRLFINQPRLLIKVIKRSNDGTRY